MLEGLEHAFLGNEMEVTAWYRFNKLADKYVFNHVSDGYNEDEESPKVVSEFQSLAWNNAKWRKYRAVIENGVLKESRDKLVFGGEGIGYYIEAEVTDFLITKEQL